jgi:hypothetical protein
MTDFTGDSGQFPKQRNREFQRAEQGIILALTGKNSGVSGIARDRRFHVKSPGRPIVAGNST